MTGLQKLIDEMDKDADRCQNLMAFRKVWIDRARALLLEEQKAPAPNCPICSNCSIRPGGAVKVKDGCCIDCGRPVVDYPGSEAPVEEQKPKADEGLRGALGKWLDEEAAQYLEMETESRKDGYDFGVKLNGIRGVYCGIVKNKMTQLSQHTSPDPTAELVERIKRLRSRIDGNLCSYEDIREWINEILADYDKGAK